MTCVLLSKCWFFSRMRAVPSGIFTQNTGWSLVLRTQPPALPNLDPGRGVVLTLLITLFDLSLPSKYLLQCFTGKSGVEKGLNYSNHIWSGDSCQRVLGLLQKRNSRKKSAMASRRKFIQEKHALWELLSQETTKEGPRQRLSILCIQTFSGCNQIRLSLDYGHCGLQKTLCPWICEATTLWNWIAISSPRDHYLPTVVSCISATGGLILSRLPETGHEYIKNPIALSENWLCILRPSVWLQGGLEEIKGGWGQASWSQKKSWKVDKNKLATSSQSVTFVSLRTYSDFQKLYLNHRLIILWTQVQSSTPNLQNWKYTLIQFKKTCV